MAHEKKPHKKKHDMTPKWKAGSIEVMAPIPGPSMTSGGENDPVQRMFDYIKDVKEPSAYLRAYAAWDATADSVSNFAALIRENKLSADATIQLGTHMLTQILGALQTRIVPAIKNGL